MELTLIKLLTKKEFGYKITSGLDDCLCLLTRDEMSTRSRKELVLLSSILPYNPARDLRGAWSNISAFDILDDSEKENDSFKACSARLVFFLRIIKATL